ARRRPAPQAGGVDYRPEKRMFQRGHGQPPVEAFSRYGHGGTGGRSAGQQSALQPGALAGFASRVRWAQVRYQAHYPPDLELPDLPTRLGDQTGQRKRNPVLFALLRPPPAGGSAPGWAGEQHRGAEYLPRLSPGRSRAAT